jgi:hypothetical protein
VSRPTERTGGWLLVIGAIGSFLFEWNNTLLSPSWLQHNPFADMWVLQLGLHTLTIGLIVGGVGLIALDRSRLGMQTTWWWVATALLFIGLTISRPAFSAGLIVLAVIVLRESQLRLAAFILTGGAVLWSLVFFAGVHIGDENSRPPVGYEKWAALIGLGAMCAGLVAVGWSHAHAVDDRVEEGSVLE